MNSDRARGGGHALVAEDNPVNERVATAMLDQLGFHVDIVADGARAVAAAARKPYEVILMDCQLPVMDGCQATSEIRRLPATSARVLIVGATVSATQSDREHCLAAGMDDCIAKPFTLMELAAVARPVLDPRVVGRLEGLGRAAGEDLMGQLAHLFLADADARIVALRRAITGADAPAVVRAAHALHGASANVGATDLADLCGSFATDGAAGRLGGRGALLAAVEAELVRVRSALVSQTGTP